MDEEKKIELCWQLMVYMAFDSEFNDSNPSELRRRLYSIFPIIIVEKALEKHVSATVEEMESIAIELNR